ncbi:MAG: proline--tRNA ligase [Verrucomicrobiota bacterium]
MRWTQQFIPTLREVPQEAEIPSHQLMLRAGLIRKLGAGLYTFLPLGHRALRKVEQIVREEMDRAGAIEVLMPAMHPREIWERTGRYELMRDVMFNIDEGQKQPMVLGPTHEEVITDLAARELKSYRQLPINFYQIQTKFRNEIRPRFGLMRAKEFIMKDAYSFDTDWESVDRSYQAMYDAYIRVFKRCGLRTKIVEADSGAMGGSVSHEFMVLAEAGEDGIVECDSCDYAANLERAEGQPRDKVEFESDGPAVEEVETPNARTVDEVTRFLKVEAPQLIKTLIFMADEEAVAVLIPGHRDVNPIKLAKVLGCKQLELADNPTIREVTGSPVGFAGPVGLKLPIYADRTLKGFKGGITGANKEHTHYLHVDIDRDVEVREYADVSFAKDGDGCPCCDDALIEKRGIEVGHVFKLGTKYSEKLGAHVLDAEGQQVPMIMGCYGIGVTRTLQSVIEQSHDKGGVIWPMSVAPYEVQVMALNMDHEESVKVVDEIIAGLEEQGIEVLNDDRAERPGVKFKDADLLGIPLRVSVGERSLAKGVVEMKARAEEDVTDVPVENALETILAKVKEMKDALA